MRAAHSSVLPLYSTSQWGPPIGPWTQFRPTMSTYRGRTEGPSSSEMKWCEAKRSEACGLIPRWNWDQESRVTLSMIVTWTRIYHNTYYLSEGLTIPQCVTVRRKFYQGNICRGGSFPPTFLAEYSQNAELKSKAVVIWGVILWMRIDLACVESIRVVFIIHLFSFYFMNK